MEKPLKKKRQNFGKKAILITLSLLLLVTLGIVWVNWENTGLEVNRYKVESEHLPESFDGFCIVHVSDLHNTQIGKDNGRLLSAIRDAKPDMIAITGDIIDHRRTDVNVALQFVEKAMEIAPCYYITGNHEAWSDQYEVLRTGLKERGVTVLENETVHLQQGEASIQLIGVMDPVFLPENEMREDAEWMCDILGELREEEAYTILLSHRPELFKAYVDSDVDLALTGHAHGGQFRLPFLGGVLVPNQGFFPEYDEGLHVEENTHMFISRGIGNSVIPIRINNRPEIIVIELISL